MIFNRSYKEIMEEVDSLEVGFKAKAVYVIAAVLISLLAISGPLAILINLLIFIDLKEIFIALIASLLILFCYLVNRIYLKLLTKGEIKDISVIYTFDTFIMAFGIIIVLAILLEIGVF